MKRYSKVIKAIEALQKYRADEDIEQHPDSFKAVFAMRQVDNAEPPTELEEAD